jgi:hypothetical protein
MIVLKNKVYKIIPDLPHLGQYIFLKHMNFISERLPTKKKQEFIFEISIISLTFTNNYKLHICTYSVSKKTGNTQMKT